MKQVGQLKEEWDIFEGPEIVVCLPLWKFDTIVCVGIAGLSLRLRACRDLQTEIPGLL